MATFSRREFALEKEDQQKNHGASQRGGERLST
jgi:hypothetical protein